MKVVKKECTHFNIKTVFCKTRNFLKKNEIKAIAIVEEKKKGKEEENP